MEAGTLHFAQQRRKSLQALLIVSAPVALLFAGVNAYMGARLSMWVALFTSSMSIGLFFGLRRNLLVEPLAVLYVLSFLAVVSAGLLEPEVHPGMSSWLNVLPVLSYLVLPIHLARFFAALSILIAATAYVLGLNERQQVSYLMRPIHALFPPFVLLVICDRYVQGRIRSQREMLKHALTDPLTGLGNRAKLSADFNRESKRSQRTGVALSLVLVDLDRFKELNDRYGHDAGDAALVFFSNVLRERIRETDLPFRFGGEEFALLLPDTAAPEAITLAEDLRRTLEVSTFEHDGVGLRMTFSAGVVELGRDGDDWPSLYRAADALLYECKRLGRNQVLSK